MRLITTSFSQLHLARLVRSLLCALTLLIFLAGGRTWAWSIRLTLQEIVVRSDLAFRARVVSTSSDWDASHQIIETTHVLQVLYPIKGSIEPSLYKFKTPGGAVGNLTMSSSEDPELQSDEEVILFLEKDRSGNYQILGEEQGKFNVIGDQVDNHVLSMHTPIGKFLDQVEQLMLQNNILPTMPMQREREEIESNQPSAFGITDKILSFLHLDGLRRILHNLIQPDNYVYNNKKWPGSNPMGESYVVNLNASSIGGSHGTANDFLNAIINAGLTWNSVATAHFDFSYGGPSAVASAGYDGINAIYWEDMGAVSTLATTTWWANGLNQIVEVDMKINDHWTWSATGSPASNEADLQSVAIHEMGHMLSLGHDDDPTCSTLSTTAPVMCSTYPLGRLKRSLHANDIAGITSIYAGIDTPVAGGTSTNTATPTGTPPNTATLSPTPTHTPTQTPTRTSTFTPTGTATFSPTLTHTPTQTPTRTSTFTPTGTATFSPTLTHTPTQTPTRTSTFTPTGTATFSPTPPNTATLSPTPTGTPTVTATPSKSPTATPTQTATGTVAATSTNTATATATTISAACLDFNNNKVVDQNDLVAVIVRWHLTTTHPDPDHNPATPNYEARYDVDGNGIIDTVDISRVVVQMGTKCP